MGSTSSDIPAQQTGSTNRAPRFAQAGPITRLSTGPGGRETNSPSLDPVLSADGSVLIFASEATNLVEGDTNGERDLFRKDLKTGAVTRVSTAADGTQSDGSSGHASLSADGTKLVFASEAGNLVTGDTNRTGDIFLKDLNTGAITRIDTTVDGIQTRRGFSSTDPVISADGTKVAFVSSAPNLVSGDTNGARDIFVKDLTTGAVTRVSTASDGAQIEAGADASDPVFSADGTKIAFVSSASNLVSGDTNDAADIFVKDLKTGAISRVSTAADGTQANDQSTAAVFSPDGTKIAFVSSADNLVAGDTNGAPDIFVKDLKTGAVTRVSTGSDGGELHLSGNLIPAFSPDGTKIAFVDSASKQAYVKDLVTGVLVAVAAVPNAPMTQRVAFTPDGGELIFVSGDGTLVPGDTNGVLDVFAAWVGPTTEGLVQDRAQQAAASLSGRLGFADPDAGDTHAVTVKPGAGTLGTLTAHVVQESGGSAAGVIAWDYAVDHEAVAALALGQTKLETFTVAVDDGHGGTAEQDVTVTIVGSNDTPRITASGPFTRLSTGSDGHQANGPSLNAVLSANGTTLVFASDASNLVDGDTNGVRDIFVKDLKTGLVTRVSTATDGLQGNGSSSNVSLSADGTKITFYSFSDDFVAGDTNNRPDAFVKDLTTGTITRINTAADGTQGDEKYFADPNWLNDGSYAPSFSPDGTKVAFVSFSSNLVPGIDNGTSNIYVKDLITGVITCINTAVDGKPVSGGLGNYSAEPLFSPDGTKVSFLSVAADLVPGDTNGAADIFVKDLATGAITRVSTAADGTQANGRSFSHVFSPDGTKVAFVSDASNLVGGDTNGTPDIFVKDLKTGAVTRVSTGSNGAQLSLSGDLVPTFSPDGTKIAFVDDGTKQAYVKDLTTGALIAVASVPNASVTQHLAFSSDGSELIFTSGDATLVAGDANNATDVFKVRIGQTATGSVQDKADQISVHTDGSLSFTDPDVGDTHTVTVKASQSTLGTLTAKVVRGSGAEAGTIAWTYTVDHAAVAYLGQGQTKVETFTVTLDDGHGGTAEQDVSVTVVGSNDTPRIVTSGPFIRLSTGSDGHEANGASLSAVISADGTKLVFVSDASDLVAGDTNGVRDLFLKDLRTGAVSRVSVAADGSQADGGSYQPRLSPDGTKLLFVSDADNLVPGDTNKVRDLFLKDLKTGAITRLNTAPDGSEATVGVDGPGYAGDIGWTVPLADFSPDGTKVIFTSADSSLVSGDTNGTTDIFVRDLKTGTTTRLSTNADGNQADGPSWTPRFSADGTKIVFASAADNLVADDQNRTTDIFVKDLKTGAVTRVDTAFDNEEADGASFAPVFTPDGSKVIFASYADNLVAGDTNHSSDIFLKDLKTGAITRLNTAGDGSQLDFGGGPNHFGARDPVLSPDGTKLAFRVEVLNTVFVKDLVSGALTPVTEVPDSQTYAFTADSRELVFASADGTLVADDTNGTLDVFKVRIGPTTAGLVRDSADRATSGTSGVLAFTDPDAGDSHTVTVKAGEGALGTLTARVSHEPGAKAGEIAWDYSVDHTAVAGLQQGQTRVETFTLTLDDGHGGTASRDVAITVYGSAPATSLATAAGSSQNHDATIDTASSTDHLSADTAHVQDTHHGHGLTGFEI